jgi:hypothetical protein
VIYPCIETNDQVIAGNTTEYGPIKDWCFDPPLPDFSQAFFRQRTVNKDLSRWNVSHAVGIGLMFNGAKSFNGDLCTGNVENVNEMGHMFRRTGSGRIFKICAPLLLNTPCAECSSQAVQSTIFCVPGDSSTWTILLDKTARSTTNIRSTT